MPLSTNHQQQFTFVKGVFHYMDGLVVPLYPFILSLAANDVLSERWAGHIAEAVASAYLVATK
jgi:hypothetical protein